ncbi:hypothetical protein MUG91_G81n148 [Manis pentadactyla]|nr:hypothetical protein MUG91_G81n148 [Manis pentadactyla]
MPESVGRHSFAPKLGRERKAEETYEPTSFNKPQEGGRAAGVAAWTADSSCSVENSSEIEEVFRPPTPKGRTREVLPELAQR